MIRVLDKFPRIAPWKRLLRWVCGGQDIVAVIVIGESGSKATLWLTGVNIENPVDVEKCVSAPNTDAKG